MGEIKYIQDIRNFFKKNIIVDINSLKKFILNKKGNEKYIHLLINHMVKRGEIIRITKGFYSIYDDPIFAVFCFKPAYIGLQSALSFHNIWEQETIPLIITIKKVRQGIRTINKNNIMLRRINKKYFFGIEYINENNYIPISDIEKTFIDMIYFNQKLDKETLNNFKKVINKEKLKKYMKFYSKRYKSKINKILNLS